MHISCRSSPANILRYVGMHKQDFKRGLPSLALAASGSLDPDHMQSL